MSKLTWKPWHTVLELREDIRKDTFTMSEFAADLYDAATNQGPKIYRDPREFFSLTYPTYSLKQLAKDVTLRLAGKNAKAIRQLKLTYGGGKTHTLITLFHLVNDPDGLPRDIQAVEEFIQEAGMTPPKARVAILSFDKIDVEKGLEVIGPRGEKRTLLHPWSILAYQLAGDDGLRLLHAKDAAEERETPPAESLLTRLLAPTKKGDTATLILLDEVLMYARQKVGLDAAWRSKLIDFFQYLTQAVAKSPRCAMVASLLATDVAKNDELGKEIIHELYTIFRREREEEVEPVEKGEVAEVLRRRFFTHESLRDREAFRVHAIAALNGIKELDEQTRKEGKIAEDEYAKSYPFHPELTDVLYGKWTMLEGFQRTRGVLRTFAMALRDAVSWDQSPLIGPNVFLRKPGEDGLSQAAQELSTIATAEEYQGKRHEWSAILGGELAKARDIQDELTGLRHREMEQVVIGTFLHSQPTGAGARASTRELVLLLGSSRPDKIDLEKGLRRWTETSWYLDEAAIGEATAGPDGKRQLPSSWRLGTKPNLRQMHHDARVQLGAQPELIEAKLIDEIGRVKWLTADAQGAGAKVHSLPERPRDIEDDGEFHYAVLGPKAASESGKPSSEARRFLDETTAADRPRINRNAVVLAVPSRDGLDAARERIRDWLAWEEVRDRLKTQQLDTIRNEMLSAYREEARRAIPGAVQQAYSVVATISDKNEVQAFKISAGDDRSLFAAIKRDPRSRIQDTAVTAEALLPEGPYDLWHAGETARRVKDLVGAFAEISRLPKMLRRSAIIETISQGCVNGAFVLRSVRPDRTVRAIWRQEPAQADLSDSAIEVVLPEAGELTELSPSILMPGVLPALWKGDAITFGDLATYFGGGRVVTIDRGGYTEPLSIPAAPRPVLEAAVRSAVTTGQLWIVSGPASLWKEELPPGIVTDGAELRAAPLPIAPIELLPESDLDAWSGGMATALSFHTRLSQRAGRVLPWGTVSSAITSALNAGFLELTVDSSPWPADLPAAKNVRMRVKAAMATQASGKKPTAIDSVVNEAQLEAAQLQDLAEHLPALLEATAGHEVTFHLRVEVKASEGSAVATKVRSILVGVSKAFRAP